MKSFAIPIIVGLVLSVLFSVAARAKGKRDASGNLVLSYPIPTKIFGGVALLAGIIGTIVIANTALQKNDKDFIPLVLECSVIFIGLPLLLCLEFFRATFLVNNDRILCDTPWTRKRGIEWRDVVEVTYSPTFRWIVIKDMRTRPIRMGTMVAGINSLVSVMEMQLPAEVYAKFLKRTKG